MAGTYRIVSAKGSATAPFCVDVAGGSAKNGANVQIYTPNFTDAQYYRVDVRPNGTYRILSRYSGKSLDVKGGTIKNDQNVQQWNSNNSRAQSWSVIPDGKTATYQGETYDTYVVTVNGTNFALDIAGGTMAARSNVRIHNANGSDAQRWMFVPMPVFSDGSIYELRSLLKSSMAVDTAGDTRGANVQLMSADDSNSQKFYVVEEEDDLHWSLLNISSGMYLDVAGGSTKSGTNVQQWTDNDGRAQRWRITQYGTTTLNGQTCAVITLGSWVTGSGLTLNMDVYNALTTNKANIDIVTAANETRQRFILYQSSERDADLPVPINIGWCTESGAEDRHGDQLEAETLYPSWDTTTSWATDAAGHYEERHRVQVMGGASGTWGAWGGWSEWSTVAAEVEGQTVWMADGLPAGVASTDRATRYELQVRACAPNADGTVSVGIEQDALLTAWSDTTVSAMGTPAFGPDGLYVDYTSTYEWGTTDITLKSVHVTATGEELLSGAMSFAHVDQDGTLHVPTDKLTRWVAEGEELTAVMDVGNDLSAYVTESSHDLDPVTYDSASGLTVTPTVTVGEGRTLTVGAENGNVIRAWAEIDGKMHEMEVVGGQATMLYPFGASFGVWSYVESTDGTSWGIWHRAYAAGELPNSAPCHAWNWKGGSFLLELREGDPLETNYTVQNAYQDYSLNQREWKTVHYGTGKEGRVRAVGSIGDALDVEGTREKLEAMLDAGHVTYRSPHGLMFDVAVTEVSLECVRGIWEVSVDMLREAT